MHVALVTESRYVAPAETDAYIDNILLEDQLLAHALMQRGITTTRVDWASDVDWSTYDAALLRTTWDYFERLPEFREWLAAVDERTRLVNPLATLTWNMDKRYLADLAERGVAVVPTRYAERGSGRSLAAIAGAEGWSEVVVKPTVSGAAWKTYRVSDLVAFESTWRGLVAETEMMVQPFLPDVMVGGEVTVVAFGGRVSHALVKRPAPGDFRVQDDHGGTVHAHQPTESEVELAERALASLENTPVYARVDMVRGPSGALLVMELELIEPELWIRLREASADAFADAFVASLG